MTEAVPISASRGGRLRAKLAVARGNARKRHARAFIARQQGALQDAPIEPSFAAVAALPDWVLSDDAERDLIAKVAALLYHRDAVDAEIDGARLAALSQVVGEDLFDDLCNCPLPTAMAETPRLPRPDVASVSRSARHGRYSNAVQYGR
jgi:hypothetical protein